MNKKHEKTFREFATQYARGFKYCFCATTGAGYPVIFSKFHYGRFLDYLDERHHIEINPTDVKAYNIYEEVMVDEIKKMIEEHKVEAKQREKELKKKEKEKKEKKSKGKK
jgi:hypothetical protein